MTCGDSSYYSMNYYPGYYPASMMRGSDAQQPSGFPAIMPSGPSYAVPVVPMGTVGNTTSDRRDGRIIYRKYPTLQQR